MWNPPKIYGIGVVIEFIKQNGGNNTRTPVATIVGHFTQGNFCALVGDTPHWSEDLDKSYQDSSCKIYGSQGWAYNLISRYGGL